MELQFFGANCIKLSTKHTSVVIDDNLKALGGTSAAKAGDVVAFTNKMLQSDTKEPKIIIDKPGEFEVSAVSIHGIAARAHMDEEKQQNAVIYKIQTTDLRIAVVGHIHPDLNEEQLEAIGTIDVLFVPVGGNGYTLDAIGALKVIKEIEPRIVIPTHYADSKLNFEVPASSLEDALKNMSMEAKETVAKLKIKEIPENMELIVLEHQ